LSGAPNFFFLFTAVFFAGEGAVAAAGSGEQVVSRSRSSLFLPKATFFFRDSAIFFFQSKQQQLVLLSFEKLHYSAPMPSSLHSVKAWNQRMHVMVK
jgi:hypothetical protein